MEKIDVIYRIIDEMRKSRFNLMHHYDFDEKEFKGLENEYNILSFILKCIDEINEKTEW